jgi:3-oxoacyl-[acyl-carrier-protein] synthase III
MPVCFDHLEQNGKLKKGTKILMNSTGSGIVVSQGLYVV